MNLFEYNQYKHRVHEIYEILFEEIKNTLPSSRVEHIGSSSIPFSLSKGDLDIFVGVPLESHSEAVDAIKEVGFVEKEGTFRSDELCMLITNRFNYDVAVQVVANNSEFENFIRFRDLLLSDKKLVESYNRVKKRYFAKEIYRSKKTEFITGLLGENKELHDFVLKTEEKIQSCFSEEKSSRITNPHWTMWIEIQDYKLAKSDLEVVEVNSLCDWDAMLQMRLKVEEAFGLTNSNDIQPLIDNIKLVKSLLDANWYLLKLEDKLIGEFGVVKFLMEDKVIGRIQDVDIIPEYQKKGYGKQLLSELMRLAKEMKLDALCLMAESSDWPKYWYLENGFKKLGST